MTASISNLIHGEIQQLLWLLIDKRMENKQELDYLQVFELTQDGNLQKVIHRQEQPPLHHEMLVNLHCTSPINKTIWCIDEGQSEMMMLPEDY